MKFSKKTKIILWISLPVLLILPIIIYNILLSQFAFKTFWLPIVETKTGLKIKTEKCSVSLFSSKNCEIRSLSCKGNGLELAVDSLSLSMNTWRFLSDNFLEVSEVKASNLKVIYTLPKKDTSKISQTPPVKKVETAPKTNSIPKIETAQKTEIKKKDGKPFSYAVTLLSVTNSNIIFDNGENDRINLNDFDLRVTDIRPGERIDVYLNGKMEMTGTLKMQKTPIKSVLKIKLPVNGNIPNSLVFSFDAHKMQFQSPKLTLPELTTKILLNFQEQDDCFEIQEASINLTGQDYVLLNLSADGKIYKNKNDSAKTKINIQSKMIDAKRIQDLIQSFGSSAAAPGTAPKQQAAPPSSASSSQKTTQTEPAPLDLSAYNGTLNLDFRKIQYTGNAAFALSGPITVKNSAITADKLKMNLNTTSAELNFFIDTGVAGGYPYKGSFVMDHLASGFILKAFQLDKSNISGAVESANLNFSGKGFTAPVWKKNLNGKLTASLRDISFPVVANESNTTVRLIILPIRLLPSVLDTLNLKDRATDLKELSTKLNNILSGSKNMELKKGTIDASVTNGKVNLKKFFFEGGTLKSESITGTINLPTEELNLNASVDTAVLVIPMQIKGTLSQPKPDYRNFLQTFAKDNIGNLLEPKNLDNTIKKADQLINIFLKK